MKEYHGYDSNRGLKLGVTIYTYSRDHIHVVGGYIAIYPEVVTSELFMELLK